MRFAVFQSLQKEVGLFPGNSVLFADLAIKGIVVRDPDPGPKIFSVLTTFEARQPGVF